MIQCKIFKGDSVETLQSHINGWLVSQNSHIERLVLHDTNHSSSYNPTEKTTVITISIFYERIKK
jgi:hypothetical protein